MRGGLWLVDLASFRLGNRKQSRIGVWTEQGTDGYFPFLCACPVQSAHHTALLLGPHGDCPVRSRFSFSGGEGVFLLRSFMFAKWCSLHWRLTVLILPETSWLFLSGSPVSEMFNYKSHSSTCLFPTPKLNKNFNACSLNQNGQTAWWASLYL